MLKRIATAIVLIPIVVLLVLHASVPLLALTTSFVALLTARELLQLTESYGVMPYYRATYVAVAAVFGLLAIDAGQQKPLLSTGIFLYSAGFLACVMPFVFLVLTSYILVSSLIFLIGAEVDERARKQNRGS